MIIAFLWVFFSLIVAVVVGWERSIGFWGSFLLCLLFSPIIGLIISFLTKSNEDVKREKEMITLQKKLVTNNSRSVDIGPKISIADEIDKLAKLQHQGYLTTEEFEIAKKKLMS